MAYEQRENTGSLFKNDKREKDTQPNATGSALIDGVAYFVDAWTNDGASGKYQQLKFKRKDKQPAPAQTNPRAVSAPQPAKAMGGGFADMDSDIPF